MKKTTILRIVLFALVLLQSISIYSQNLKPFTPRFDKRLKGDMLLIGNNILNRNKKVGQKPNDSYNGAGYNSDFSMEYINVDSDGGKNFSSSKAKLTIPKPECYKIVYAGLYWGAILQQNDRSNIEKVRLKLPNATTYEEIKGTIVYDANTAPIGADNNKAYACYADITSLIANLTDAQGEYTVANVISSTGGNGGTGLSAGWSIFVVYEDPTLTAKYITTFDGFSGIGGPTTLAIPISGFKTIPTGPVRVKFAFAALEGDQPIKGDYLQINGTSVSAVNSANITIRAEDNFFNSSVTYIDPATGKTEDFLDRTPSSTNTLGYDAGILNISNPKNGIIANNATNATITLGSTQDVYFYYFNAFAVDIIEPKIVLTKTVWNDLGENIGNKDVVLGQPLNYVIGIQNTGNDNATSLTIRDRLPINTIFNYPADIVSLPTGVTFSSYNAATRDIFFNVSNTIVKVGDALKEIRLKVKVVPLCNMLSDACSNSIDNTAYATYKGTLNPDFTISDDPSYDTNTGCLLVPKATNFLVDIDNCLFKIDEVLCGTSVTLKAANGYSSYSWSSSPTGTPVIGTNQTLTVSAPGKYYVHNTAIAPCLSINQEVTVTPFGGTLKNPVIGFHDKLDICPNDGKELPSIFLCGAKAFRDIKTGISDGSVIVWEKLNEASCAAVVNTNCANESTSCTWSSVGTGPDYHADASGQYRVTLNYEGGCFNRYYFNVYQNLLDPTVKTNDIICTTPGKITVGGVPTGYVYSLSETGPWQPSNEFPINTPNSYTVYIKQVGNATNLCVFSVPDILIRKRDFTVTPVVKQPLCHGDKGDVTLQINDVEPQYYVTVKQAGTTIFSSGPDASNTYKFTNLNPGTYDYTVTTDDGCIANLSVTIVEPAELKATSALTKPLTCIDGEITVTPTGGTPPYSYFVNSTTKFQGVPQIVVTNPLPPGGLYTIKVVDDNNCETTTSITVAAIPKPEYTLTSTNNKCYGDASGEIKFNVTNANGYTLKYSINNGANFYDNPVFPNLASGTYTPVLQYSLKGAVCTDVATPIVITAPGTALTASGGVSRLAGCGALGEGTLRITNAQGGTPNYNYSFDGGATYQTTNVKDVMPGTYILVIKDSQGCTFTMPAIVLDPKPADPTITVATPSFNCDGSGTTTATVTNPGGVNYSYEYYIDTVANSPITNNVFTKVPSGPHMVSVKYILKSVSTYSNLLFEDFGVGGNTTTPGIASAYCFHDLSISPSTCTNKASTLEDNQYAVTKAIVPNNSAWYAFKDHTTNGTNPNARFLAINIGSAAGANGVLYSKTINDIIPNQPIIVEAYLANLFRANFVGGYDPSFAFELIDSSGTIIAQQPPIPPTPNPTNIPAIPTILRSNAWELRTVSLNPGNHTSLIFRVRSGSIQYSGNDGAIDDIKVYQLPESCATTKDFNFTVPSNKAFTASVTGHKNVSCSDAADGTITIAAQNFNTTTGFYYAVDGATTFSTSTTSPVTITGLSAGAHTVKVQYDLTSSPCPFTLPQTVTAPTAVTLTASITKQANCSAGATITAVGSGGTPALEYELRLSDGTTVVSGFNFSTSAVFTNVPTGNYKVYVRDANLCGASTAAVPINVNAPTPPVASLAASSDLCYDATNKATLVVTATGTGTLTYSLDGQAPQNSNTFSNVGPGTHSIVVTDSNNCTAPLNNIVIAPEIKASPFTSKTLDCTASPNAVIDVTITDGTAPYTYKVKLNSGSYGSSVNVTLNPFSYSAATQGNYTFQITDAKGCVKTTSATVDAISKPTATATPTDPTCHDATDGQVQIVGAGGSGGYTYSFNGAAYTTSSLYTGQNANTTTANTTVYSYQVKDSKDCTSPIYYVTLNNPVAVVASASIGPNTTCSTTTLITASGAGGTGTYTYSFNGSTTYTSTNTLTVTNTSAAQTITYSVKDAKGCTSTKTISIPAYNPPTGITFSTPAAITCKTGFTTTSITLTPVAGVAPFTYVITAPAASITNVTGVSSGIFTGLSAGTYTFKVTDANGCAVSASQTIAPAPIIAVAGGKTDEKCNGANDGTATFTITGASSSATYTYTLTPSSVPAAQISKSGNTVTVTGLGAGTYTLTVTDVTTGCISNTASVTVSAATAINFTLAATKTSCNNALSTISFPTLSGGTPGYTYAYATSPSTVPTTAYGTTTTVDTAVLTNSIDVWVKDNNGCTAKVPITIGTETAPTINTPAAQCYTGTPISVTITGTATGTTSYSKDGTNYQSSATFSLNPGSYILYIKDGFGCVKSTPYVVASQLTVSAIAAADTSCTPNTTINLTAAGGTGPYTYEVSSDGGTSYAPASNPFVTPTAGTYIFRVTDSGSPACQALSSSVVVTTKATVLTLTTSHTDVKCKGDATGTITITPTSGKAPYTYSVTQGVLPISTSANTTGLVAGIYDIIITDALGCTSASTAVTILEPANALGAAAAYTPTTTCSTTATITVTATGGTGLYTYSFNGGAFTSTNTFVVNDNGVSDQVVAYQVKDANGCITVSKNITVFKLNPPTGITFSTPAAITCQTGFTTTSITLTPVAGVAPFTYEITAPAASVGNSTGTFTGLSAGTYTFKVTDANGCAVSASQTIAPAPIIAVAGVKIDEKCSGNLDGKATFTITGASSSSNYTYTLTPSSVPAAQISKSGNTVTVTGLGAGTYTLTVTDVTTGCISNTASVTVSAATAINFTLAATKTSCNNALSTISFPTLSGGTPGYTYAYVKNGDPQPAVIAYGTTTTVDTAVLTNSIDVWVKDNNGCTANKTITIGTETAPTINTPAAQCYTGTPISVTITGTATGTTTYSKDGTNYQSSATFSLNPGSYTLYIKDGFGCVKSTPYVVASQLTVSAIAAADATCTPNTTINLTAAGGTGAYTYEVSSDGGTSYAPASNPFVTATAGTYIFRVTDSGSPACQALSSSVVVTTKATILTLTTSHTDVKCKGDATGTITITPTSGKAPYTYSVTQGVLPISTTANTTGLVAGIYDIAITDALGCTSASTAVTILEPAIALSATAAYTPTTTCSTTATVTVTGHDGTGTYTYSFKGGAFTTTNTYVVNDNGTDQVIAYQVKDANGCITASQNITVFKLNPPTDLTFTPSGAITCTASTTTITLGSTGGSGTLQYETISPSPIIRGQQTSNAFAGLTPGTYLFKVTDANGCSDTKSYTIAPVTPITITGQTISNVLCTGFSTGIAKYTVTGFSTTGNYAVVVTPTVAAANITTVGDVITLSNLAVGTYNVKVTDNTTGCTDNTDVTITQPTNALAATFTTVNANCKTATAKVIVNATAGTGTPGYTYAYMQDGVAPIASNYVASNVGNLDPTTNLNWDVWVKDANGCTVTLDVTIATDPTPTVTASVTNQCTASGSTFQIEAVGADGVAPYTYTINTGVAPTGALLNIFTVAKGTYTITIKDANGCTSTDSVTVNDAMAATAALTKDLDCTVTPDATITVTANGGKLPYSYEVSSDAGVTYIAMASKVYTATAAGTYQFQVTDANGCTKVTNSIKVDPIVYPVILSLTPTNIKCHGDDTGVIVVAIDATKGVGPFTYSLNGGADQSSNTFTGLIAGSYTVTVKDSKGCVNTIVASTTITEPTQMVIVKTVDDVQCTGAGVSMGSIIIDKITDGVSTTGGTGGTAPYTYYVTGLNGYDKSENNIPGNASITFTIIDFGLYQIRVVDANGCSVVENDVLVGAPVNSLGLNVVAGSDCLSGGTATVQVTSAFAGAGPFHFNIYKGPGQVWTVDGGADGWQAETTPKETIFNNLTPGITYTFIVYDEGTHCYYYQTALIPVPTNSSLSVPTVAGKNITCKGSADGNVSFEVANTSSSSVDYTYTVMEALTNAVIYTSGTFTVAGSSTTTFSSIPSTLPVGSYYIYVKETSGANAGCGKASGTFSIKESPVLLSVTASVIKNENCNNLGIINAVAKDGTAPYSFMISTLATSPIATDPAWAATTSFSEAAGSYYVYVKDAYGCIQSSAVVPLTKDPEPVIALAVVDACAAEGDFALTVSLPTAGIAPYTITVNGGAVQNITAWPYTVSNLNSGLQTIVVKDVNGCSSTQTVMLHKKLSVEAALTKELDCTTSPDATITLSVADGLFTSADVLSDFSFEVSTDNGVTYGAIVPFAVDIRTATYTATTAGTYQFRITDLNACTVESTVVTVDPKVDPTATATFTNPSCSTFSDGTLTITATLGVPPYEYTKDAGTTWQTDNTFTGLSAGTVNYTVKDAKECTFTGSETLVDPITLAATAAITDYACNASNIPQPAIVTVNVTAGTGTAPYKYNFDGSTTYLDSNTYVVGDLLGQTVHYYVKDFNGCLFDNTITVNAYQPITDITFVGTAPTCPTPTSDVTLTVVGGYVPIAKYEIVSPAAVDNGASNVFLALAPDTTYLFKVTDDNGCSFEKSYTVKAVTPIAIVGALVNDISCNPVNGTTANGKAEYTVTGFSATGNYGVVVTPPVLPAQISQSGDVITLTDLSAGTYNVAVTDNTTGCTEDADVTITLPAPIAFTPLASKVFCSKEDSQITVSAVTGGTGVYTYAVLIAGSVVAPTYTNSNVLTVDTNNFADLSWDVYVKDANGCVAVQTVAVPYETAPTFAGPIPTQCFVGSPLTVDLSTAGYFTVPAGVASYTVNGSDIVGSMATLNAATSYTFGVRDVNGCEITTSFVVNPQVQITATLVNDLTCLVDATISFVATNGSGVYTTYEVDSGSGFVVIPNANYTAATAGTYKFRVTDDQGCQAESNEIIVTPKTVPTFTKTQVNVSCNGENNGSILVSPADGIAPYTFALSGPVVNTTGDASGSYTGLIAGSYTIVVTDAKGCTSLAAAAIVITQPAILTATHSFPVNTTCSVATVITVVGAAGTPLSTVPGYYYNFNGNGYTTTDTFTVNDNGAIQSITYTVKDANGCETALQTVTINPLNKPTDLLFALTTAPTCPVSTSGITVTASNGVGALTFEITEFNGTATALYPAVVTAGSGTPATFNGLAAGDYMFKVTDANGCSFEKSYTVKAVTPIAIVGALVNDISCNPVNGTTANGKAEYTVTGFSATGNYSIGVTSVPAALPFTQSVSGDVITLTGLSAGTYNVEVTDNTTGCKTDADVTITLPTAITFTPLASKVFCSKTDSEITISAAAGGTGVYSYAYVKTGVTPVASDYSNSTSGTVNTLTNGLSYDVYVKDDNNCVAMLPVTVVQDAAPTISVPAQQCYTGSPLTVDLSTLTTTYNSVKTYTLDGSALATSTATFNAAGTYSLGIKDDNGCEAFVNYTIEKQLLATANSTKELYCTAPIDATIKVDIEGGVAPYNYQMYLNGTAVGITTPVVGTTFTKSVATVGDYTFTITDGNAASCSVTTTAVTVATPATPTFTETHTDVSCNGGNNGSITITPANGIAPYTFALTGTVPNATGDSTGLYTGLVAGSYTVVVTDAYGCTSAVVAAIPIGEPFPLTATTAAFATKTSCDIDTKVQVIAAGGTTPYYYDFGTGFDSVDSITVNDTGADQLINYTVKDGNGCTFSGSVTVFKLNAPTSAGITGTTIYCSPAPKTTSTVTVSVTSGTGVGTLAYSIVSGPVINTTGAANGIFTGLTPGDYTFQVTDANGCLYQELYTVKDLVNIAVSGQTIADMSCHTGDNGQVSFDVSGFTGNYTYSVTKDGNPFIGSTPSTLATIPLNTLGFGVYAITVTDNTTLCTATASATVLQPAQVMLTLGTTVKANCKTAAQVQVIASGGTPGFTYSFVKAGDPAGTYTTSDSALLDPAISTTWDVYVKDANGCTALSPLNITIATDPLPAGFTATVVSQCPSATGTYDFNVNVGTGMTPFEYSIGNGFQTSTAFTVDAPGTYNLIVKDKFGCTAPFPAAVTILEPIALKTTITKLPSCYDNDGSITASATGGSGNYSFQLDGGTAVVGATATFSTVSAGSHTILVTDTTTLCIDTETLNLIAASPISGMVATKTDVTCNGGTNGTIDVTLDANAVGVNDDPIYTYTLVGTTTVGSLPVNVGPQQASTFTGLSAGTYTVTVTSGRGCVDSKTLTIVEPAIIIVPTPIVTQFGCTTGTNSTNYATITAGTVTGGSGVYTYEFVKDGVSVQKGPDDSYTDSILTGGSFTINVTDDKGCTGSSAFAAILNPFISLDKVNVSVTTPITCSNDETITLTVDTTGGIPAFGDLSYTLTGYPGTTYTSVTNTTGSFSNLVVGQYLIEVTNAATGCSIQSVHYVNNPNTFVLAASNIVDLKCFADTDGSATVTLVDTVISTTDPDQAGAFNYTVKNAAGTTIIPSTPSIGVTANIAGLTSGVYTVEATLVNSPYCSVSTNFSITGPTAALSIVETHTAITCEAADSGSISVTATGGWPGDYQYQLLKGSVEQVPYGTQTYFENLTAGSYTVNVKDSSGCVASTAAIVLVDPTPITINVAASATLLSCYGDKTATVTASGVTGGQGANYLYTLNTTNSAGELTSSGPQSDPVFSGLGIGSYTITVTDGWGCSMTSTPVVITEPAVVAASLAVASTQTCAVQTQLTLSATGGTGPYTYSADAAFTSPLGTFASYVSFPVPVGTHHYYVQDAHGCFSSISNDIKIDPLPTLEINVDKTNAVINCKGDVTGVIVATAVGGIGNYTFTLLNGLGAPVTPAPLQTTPGNFTQLAAGSYQVQVTSGVDCGPVTTTVIEIKEPPVGLTAIATPTDVTCNGAGNGIITVTASGGTGIIKYAITPYLNQFFETNSFINLKTGSYDLIAQDENGCYVYMTGIKIGEPSPLKATVIAGSIVPEVCSGDSDGEFTIAIIGGTADYKVSLDKASGPFTSGTVGQTDFNFQNLKGGAHKVYIVDAMGCNYELDVVLPDAITLNPVAIVAYDCLNNLPSNTITVKVDSSIVLAEVDYALDGLGTYQASNVFTNVSAGPHFVSVRHSNGCIKPTQSFTMLQINPLAVSIGDGGLNEIVATTTGGSGIYHYTFNGESTGTNNTYIYYHSGDYTVEVIDGEGCTATDTKPFVFIDINIPNVFTPNGDGNNDVWGPTNTTNYPDIVYHIYDRYGRVVGTYHKDQFWDGKYNGLELPSGDYWYTLKLNNDKDAREFVGHFTLYR